jgi:hypothetical protein
MQLDAFLPELVRIKVVGLLRIIGRKVRFILPEVAENFRDVVDLRQPELQVLGENDRRIQAYRSFRR